MSHKPTRKQREHMQRGKPVLAAQKLPTWTIPAILGLILGVLGLVGLIELRVQLNINPQEQLAANEPFSAPFEITNTGYLSVYIRNVTVIWPRVEFSGGPTIENASTNDNGWDDFELERGESKTILPHFSNGRPQKANVVIAVDYGYFGTKGRRLFRFEGTYMERWEWSKQPVNESDKKDFERQVDYSLNQHSKLNMHR